MLLCAAPKQLMGVAGSAIVGIALWLCRTSKCRALASVGPSRRSKEAEAQALKSYDAKAQQLFYQLVMGGGDNNIHYGLFMGKAAGSSSQIKEASKNTITFDADLLDVATGGTLGAHSKILELGSATGGAACELIRRFGCHVTGLNISPGQNAVAEKAAQQLGFGERFSTFEGSFDETWPLEWTECFDAVFSIDSLVYSQDKAALMQQVARVLKPGGVMTFSDVLATESGSESDRRAITKVLPGLNAARATKYMACMSGAGLGLSAYVDLTRHLGLTYSAMKHQIDIHRKELLAGGNTVEHLDQYRESLIERVDLIQAGEFSIGWGAFSAKKAPVGPMGDAVVSALRPGTR